MNDRGLCVNSRKIEHIDVVRNDDGTDRNARHFDRIHLVHRALPEIDLKDIDPRIQFMGKTLSFPLLISSMTGGEHELVERINRNLAIAAEKTGVALAVGSQRVMFENSRALSSFELRRHAPQTLLFANLGAVQLNCGFTVEHCRRAVEVVGADALFLHLNALQEAVQPEGDTVFAGLTSKIAELNGQLDVPLVLKEVGCGFSCEDILSAAAAGVRFIDVAGQGGTSWSRIEHRRTEPGSDLGLVFQDWGIPTPRALKLASSSRARVELIASGGLRNGIDMAKSVILGARLCGLAAPFLEPAVESAESVVAAIEALKRQFVTAMFLLGTPDIAALWGNKQLILDDFS